MLIGPVADLIKTVLNKTLPDKISQEEKAKIALQLQEDIMKYDWSAVEKEFQDRADARALAAADVAKGNWFTNVLAATVRPVFGYLAMAAFFLPLVLRLSATIAGHPMPDVVLNDVEKEVTITIIYFFFGGRTVEKGLAIWKNGNGNGATEK